MRATRAEDVLGRITLVTGKEEFLNERTVSAVKTAVRAYDAEAELSETLAGDLTLAALGELAAPSLFSSTRGVVVRALENLPEESVAGIVDCAKTPADDVALVLVHGGGVKGSGLLKKLRALGTVTEVKSAEVKGWEMGRWAVAEARGLGTKLDEGAAEFLVQAVGQDLRSLAAAIRQLGTDFPGEPLTTDKVKRYFGGRAEATSFAVADHAFFGRTAQALEELRWAIDGGTSPVLITSAFASGARGIAKLIAAPRGLSEGALAGQVGVPPWKLKSLRPQAKGFTPRGIGLALRAIAEADADIKGKAHDAPYTLERLVLTVTELREVR
jgi:DNA polymerase-3 subunit delta